MYFNHVSFPGPFQLLNTCSTGKQGGEGARYSQPQNKKAAFSMLLDQLHIHHIVNTTVSPCSSIHMVLVWYVTWSSLFLLI